MGKLFLIAGAIIILINSNLSAKKSPFSPHSENLVSGVRIFFKGHSVYKICYEGISYLTNNEGGIVKHGKCKK